MSYKHRPCAPSSVLKIVLTDRTLFPILSHHEKEFIIKLHYLLSCPSGAAFEKVFQNSMDCLVYDLRRHLTETILYIERSSPFFDDYKWSL